MTNAEQCLEKPSCSLKTLQKLFTTNNNYNLKLSFDI